MSKQDKIKKISTPSNISLLLDNIKSLIYNKIILKIKGYIIHMWINDFEDQYLKTFKVIVNPTTDPKSVINTLHARMETYDYKDKYTIILKYAPNNSFSILASQTKDEKEYDEFQKWKKTHKKEILT